MPDSDGESREEYDGEDEIVEVDKRPTTTESQIGKSGYGGRFRWWRITTSDPGKPGSEPHDHGDRGVIGESFQMKDN